MNKIIPILIIFVLLFGLVGCGGDPNADKGAVATQQAVMGGQSGAVDQGQGDIGKGGFPWWAIVLIILGVAVVTVGVLIALKVIKLPSNFRLPNLLLPEHGYPPDQAYPPVNYPPTGYPPQTPVYPPQPMVPPPGTKVCGQCGNYAPETAGFCPRCGNKIA